MSATSPVPSVVRSTSSSWCTTSTPSPVSRTSTSSTSTPAATDSAYAYGVECGWAFSPPAWASTTGRSIARTSSTVVASGAGAAVVVVVVAPADSASSVLAQPDNRTATANGARALARWILMVGS